MKIVCDSSILIHLSMIGRFHLLKQLFKNIIIPEGVYIEVVEEGWGLPGSLEVSEGVKESWIIVQNVIDKEKVREIANKYKINLPNAEVIQLSRENQAKLVLVDEEEIRRAAKDFGVAIKGCLGILLKAVEEEFITSFDALNDIQELIKVGYRIEESIINQIEQSLRR